MHERSSTRPGSPPRRLAGISSILVICLVLAGCSAPGASSDGPGQTVVPPGADACVATPRQAQGPYFRADAPERQDVNQDSGTLTSEDGVRLMLQFHVSVAGEGPCSPLVGARVDVWHANATGVYSGFAEMGTQGHDALRGHQTTDANGNVTFYTIFPGWYPGRTLHLHVKVTAPGAALTTQLYLDGATTSQVMAMEPYAAELPWPPGGTRHNPYCFPFNLTEQPALSVCCGFTSSGLPVGLQIVGRRHADHMVLAACAAFEAARPWSERRPPA